jgi:hypothetical protein
MLNLTGMVRAPSYDWEVSMSRNKSLNAVQNARKRIAYVKAANEKDAMREAKKKYPEFHPSSARRVF